VVLEIFNNLESEVFDDAVDALVAIHHFLMVALNLVRGPCRK